MGGRSVLLKPAVKFILLQQSNGLSQNIWIIFHSNCVFKNNGPTIRFRDAAHQTWFFDKCRGFSRSACGFSALHVVLFQVEPYFVRRKKIVFHLNPFVWKPHVLDYRLTVELVAIKRRWTVLNELANVGSVHRGEGGLVSCMFVSVFTVLTHVSFLGCVLHGTFCTCAACFLPTPCLSLVRNKLTQLQTNITEHVTLFSCYMVISLLGRTVTPALPHG